MSGIFPGLVLIRMEKGSDRVWLGVWKVYLWTGKVVMYTTIVVTVPQITSFLEECMIRENVHSVIISCGLHSPELVRDYLSTTGEPSSNLMSRIFKVGHTHPPNQGDPSANPWKDVNILASCAVMQCKRTVRRFCSLQRVKARGRPTSTIQGFYRMMHHQKSKVGKHREFWPHHAAAPGVTHSKQAPTASKNVILE